MPQLKNTARAEGSETPVVRFYKGEKGSEELSRYLLRKAKKGDEIYCLYDIDEDDKVNHGITPNARVKKGIKAKLLYHSDVRELTNDKKWLRESKRINRDIPAEINLYTDKASLITYDGKNTVGVLIESRQIVKALRQLFEEAFEK